MMGKMDDTFEREWQRAMDKRQQGKGEAMKKAVARSKARRTAVTERATSVWKAVRQDAKEERRKQGNPAKAVERGRTVGEFLGRGAIGFRKDSKPVLLQRKGKTLEPPKHWTEDQVEQQEMRDMVLLSRAAGTWSSYI